MDLRYLMFLQNLREAAPTWVSSIFVFLSELVVSAFVFVVPAVLFWCYSKRAGSFMGFALNGSACINSTIKLTACVYRPWIRDPQLHTMLPGSATGYSFPSGHTTAAVALYGSIGLLLKKVCKWILVGCLVMAAVTGFARNWVGAHTPQDVVCGFTFSLIELFALQKLFAFLDEHPEKDVLVTVVGCALAVAMLVYMAVKPYPMDYTAEGELLVDPKKMMNDGFGDVGRMIGFLVGWLIERRWIRFRMEGSPMRRIIRAVLGVATLMPIYFYSKAPMVALFGSNVGNCLRYALICLYIIAGYPLLIKLAQNALDRKTAK